MNKEAIKKIIPHRDPFLFVDEVLEMEPLKYCVGVKHVSEELDFFAGHFPEKKVMPGVIIVEALAQVGAITLLSGHDYKGKIAYFTGIDKVRFRRSVFPGDTLILKCEITKIRGPFGFGQAKAYVDEQLVCEATISFSVGS
jgi:3-hydroxyacyl-[acyl-carrier-protein] dehydratase